VLCVLACVEAVRPAVAGRAFPLDDIALYCGRLGATVRWFRINQSCLFWAAQFVQDDALSRSQYGLQPVIPKRRAALAPRIATLSSSLKLVVANT
jgi:hypothetical protein